MSSIESTLQSFLAFLSSAFNSRDLSPVYPGIVTSDCTIQLVPASFLKRSGLPPDFSLTHEQWTGHMAKHFPAVASATTETFETVIDNPNKKAVVHLRFEVTLVDNQSASLEYAIFLYFRDVDGEARISKIVEFVDGEAGAYQGTVEKLLAKLEAEKGGK